MKLITGCRLFVLLVPRLIVQHIKVIGSKLEECEKVEHEYRRYVLSLKPRNVTRGSYKTEAAKVVSHNPCFGKW